MEKISTRVEGLSTRHAEFLDYLQTHDLKYVAEDAVYHNMATGEVYTGKAEIGAMLHFIYKVAFDARPEIVDFYITDDKAMVEGFFNGRHIGEFFSIPPTNATVKVPMAVTYKLAQGLIQEARIYFQSSVLMQQLGISSQPVPLKTTFVVRDIFQLRFGHYKEAKQLLDEAIKRNMMPDMKNARILTDFTGDAYRLIFEEGFDQLADYELSLNSSMKTEEWQQWYAKFKPHVERSHREILKQVI